MGEVNEHNRDHDHDHDHDQKTVGWIDHLSGWLVLGSGLLLVSLGILTPLWLELDDLTWQRDLMARQATDLGESERVYQQFHDALWADDPILLERLAYQHLRLKPSGATALAHDRVSGAQGFDLNDASLDSWLRRRAPRQPVNLVPRSRPRSMLVTIMTGWARALSIAVGLGALGMGLLLPGNSNRPIRAA